MDVISKRTLRLVNVDESFFFIGNNSQERGMVGCSRFKSNDSRER